MIIEVGGAEGGLKKYLEHGRKQGRELHRDQLDQRIALIGDLEVFELAISEHDGNGKRYDHISLGFSENHVTNEMLLRAAEELRDHVLAAWPESERHRIGFYAEAHRPKILSYTNSLTGKEEDRLIHIHIGIGRRDLLTGKSIEPLGFLGPGSDNLKFIDAFQESFNARHGFTSPKDNPKITPENAVDVLARYTGNKPDALGTFTKQKSSLEVTLQKEILIRDITTWDGFAQLLAEHGEVSKMHDGQFNECFRIMPVGAVRAMRLKGVFFQRQFIERPTAEKLAVISSKAKAAYLEQMQPKKESAYVAATLKEWRETTSREIRYIHKSSPFYKQIYKPADAETRQHLLDQLEMENHGIESSRIVPDLTHLTPKQIAKGVEHVLRRSFDRGIPPEHVIRAKQHIRRTAAERIGSLHELPASSVDGGRQNSGMLLQGAIHNYVGNEQTGQDQDLRRSGASETSSRSGGGDDSIAKNNTGSGTGHGKSESRRSARARETSKSEKLHVVQPSSVLARIEADLRDRYEQAADKERYAEIRKNLDCTQLLSRLSHSHGLNPELYQVATGKDGTPRIECGSRALTPSDFLTKEMGLSWKEAARVLRQVYEHQINSRFTRPRTAKATPSLLWMDFKAMRKVSGAELSQCLKTFNADAKKRRMDLAATLKSEEKNALFGLSGPARKAEMALKKLRAATTKAELSADIKEERQMLRESFQPTQTSAWGLFLQTRAQAGDEEALVTLRKLDDTARAAQSYTPSITGTIILDDEDEKRRRRFAVAIFKFLSHVVEVNGDVTYRLNGRAILRDEGRHLAVLDEHSEEAIVFGLLIAREKFNGVLLLTGSESFRARVVVLAVSQGIVVKFADPALEEMRLNLIEEKRHAMQSVCTLARERPEPVSQLIALSNKSAQQEQAQPAVAVKAQAFNTKLTPTQEEKIMATEQDHKLVQQATAKREANSHYQPTLVEMKAVDQVLIEQAKEMQQKAVEAPKLSEPSQPSDLDQQAQRAVAPAAEKPATEQPQPETIVEPTLQLSAAEWIATQYKPEVQPHQFGDGTVEFVVSYVALDGVVIDHGRTFAQYSIRPGTDWHVGQKIVIDKSGSIAVPTGRAGHVVSKGRAD